MKEEDCVISGEAATQIVIDIGNQIPPDKSKLKYGPEELAFRGRVEKRWEAYRAKHPDAILDVKE